MFEALFNNPLSFVLWAVALVIALTIHEFAHAWMAERLGDPTPRLMGRLTLNPLAHLDPLGTIMLLIARFGWGKPVQFDPFNLRNPKRDSALISLAGPGANFLLATLSAIVLQLVIRYVPFITGLPDILTALLVAFLQYVITLCVVLGVFNLIPIHPLDGFKIVEGLLPGDYARQWHELEPYGMIFLLFLIFPLFGPSPIAAVISPVINFLVSLLTTGLAVI